MTGTIGDLPPMMANFVLAALLLGIITLAIGAVSIVYIFVSPDHDACEELNNQPFGIVLWECADGMEANPGATGQKVLDHYDVEATIERLLVEPLSP